MAGHQPGSLAACSSAACPSHPEQSRPVNQVSALRPGYRLNDAQQPCEGLPGALQRVAVLPPVVSFEGKGLVVAVALEGLELPPPIDEPSTHRSPLDLAGCVLAGVLDVHMADT